MDGTLADKIRENKSHFSQYNIVRMREAIRYLAPPKLEIFIKIPVMIHFNLPDFPGYIPSETAPNGIYRFEKSGFFKTALQKDLLPRGAGTTTAFDDPAVQGLYHIGSLGTFTQSPGSDFDYWVIIDKTRFTGQRYYDFEKRLNHIVKHSRVAYDQEVTFFILDKEDIRQNNYAPFSGRETLTAPKIFLKEEFYRTFLMIAGKIPFWAILPDTGSREGYDALIREVSGTKELTPLADDALDLGHIRRPDEQDILKGLLWHICKSRSDPVKALIKAAMIYMSAMDRTGKAAPLCNEIKTGYAGAGIDDYRVDPYKALFDGIIRFHEKNDPKGLGLIKNAIFLRLSSFPAVSEPETGSPKKQLLDRYIRNWNLKSSRVNKLFSYRDWAESEKLILEKTIVDRLSFMYKQAAMTFSRRPAGLRELITEKRNFRILTHKTMERLKKDAGKIPLASCFLRRQKFMVLLFTRKRLSGWHLGAYSREGHETPELYNHPHLLGTLGWIMENNLYHRSGTSLKIDVPERLFESHAEPVDPDKLYLVLQPVKPLTDDCFENAPVWSKLLVLLIYSKENRLEKAEFLAANTWGELFVDALEIKCLENQTNLKDNLRQIAEKITDYNTPGLRTYFFQLSSAHDPDVVYRIKQHLGPPLLRGRGSPGKAGGKRPLLDSL